MKHTSLTSTLAAFTAAITLIACDSGDTLTDDESVLESATVRVLIGDAPVDDLVSFSAVIVDVRLVRDGGQRTDNLLAGPLTVEFLGLEDSVRWLSESTVDEGDYVRVEVGFRPGSYAARASDGLIVAVDALSDELSAPILLPETLAPGALQAWIVELDLSSSLSGKVASGRITFDPSGETSVAEPGERIAVEELDARVFDRDTGTLALSVDAFADEELRVPLARVPITVDASTLLVDRLGNEIQPPAYYYTYLYRTVSIVEVDGMLLADGALRAQRIELEEQAGVPGTTYPVKLDGKIAGITQSVLELQLQEVSRGAQFADPVLASLGDPAFVEVSLSTQKLRVFLDNGFATPQDFEVGQRAEVKFTSFVAPPFPAARVDLLAREPELAGTLTNLAAAPASFELELPEHALPIHAGLVASQHTPVLGEPLVGMPLVLDTAQRPLLASADLVPGLKVLCRGPIRGSPAAPRLQHAGTRVRPGRLVGARVTSVEPLGVGFTTTGGMIQGSFGAGISPGPFRVLVDPSAVVAGAAHDAAALHALFANLQPGLQLVVSLDGLGTGAVNELRAFTIRARVE
jgi:hypothetical protein